MKRLSAEKTHLAAVVFAQVREVRVGFKQGDLRAIGNKLTASERLWCSVPLTKTAGCGENTPVNSRA